MAEPTLRAVYRQGEQRLASLDQPRWECEQLLLKALARPHWQVATLIAHFDDAMPADASLRWEQLVTRRLAGEPLAYVLGEWSFMGYPLRVGPGVLIPRPETEVMVAWLLEHLPQRCCAVLDLGTGSGAIACAVALACPKARVWATERSDLALGWARCNSQALEASVTLCQGDWFNALPISAPLFDCVISNPPYLRPDDPHLEALEYEPLEALVSQSQGMADLAHLIQEARRFLTPEGWLVLEHGFDQGSAVRALFKRMGYRQTQTHPDLQGHGRFTVGQCPRAPRSLKGWALLGAWAWRSALLGGLLAGMAWVMGGCWSALAWGYGVGCAGGAWVGCWMLPSVDGERLRARLWLAELGQWLVVMLGFGWGLFLALPGLWLVLGWVLSWGLRLFWVARLS